MMYDDRPIVSDALLGIIGATFSGLIVGVMLGISIMWLSAAE